MPRNSRLFKKKKFIGNQYTSKKKPSTSLNEITQSTSESGQCSKSKSKLNSSIILNDTDISADNFSDNDNNIIINMSILSALFKLVSCPKCFLIL